MRHYIALAIIFNTFSNTFKTGFGVAPADVAGWLLGASTPSTLNLLFLLLRILRAYVPAGGYEKQALDPR
jgi:hypothetical protein